MFILEKEIFHSDCMDPTAIETLWSNLDTNVQMFKELAKTKLHEDLQK